MRASPALLLMLSLGPAVAVADEIDTPSQARLEYLGEWQDDNGKEIDPQALALMPLDATQGGGESNDEE